MAPEAERPLESLLARLEAADPGLAPQDTVPSGFPSLDRMLGGGFRRQDLIVLAGDVGSGKSALALAMAIRAARAGLPTLMLSGEASPERVLERALALEARCPIDDLRQGRLDPTARAAVSAAAASLRDAPLFLRPLLGTGFEEVVSALGGDPGPALLVVDSIQLTPPPVPATHHDERLVLVVRALKALALQRNLAVLALAQLPALHADRADPRPTLDDLGALGAIKESADLVLGIYREEMYRPGHGIEGATELIVAKHRNGPTGFVDLFFYPKWVRFEDMLDPDG
ncbi:MAG: DnaB-like helicase C-terminal domain-containing protein [Gemmatimonadales bacterium]